MKKSNLGGLHPLAKGILLLLPFLTGAVCLCIGRISYSPQAVWTALFGTQGDAQLAIVVQRFRLPRIVMAGLVGAGLSVSGCTLQSLFANPLATPDTLGIASGTSFGAALAFLLGMRLMGVQCMAFAFGLLAVLLTWGASAGKGKAAMQTVVLSGIMTGSLFNALISLVKFAADTESKLPAITYWLMGSMSGAGEESLLWGAPTILLGMVILYLLRWKLNLLPLGEEEAQSLGTNLRALRIVCIACVTAVSAACVSLCGQVGWVGLLIPHICRMAFGANHRALIPASVSIGAAFLMIVDTMARSLSAAELPISILTAIIGAPFFIVLMRRSGGWSL